MGHNAITLGHKLFCKYIRAIVNKFIFIILLKYIRAIKILKYICAIVNKFMINKFISLVIIINKFKLILMFSN